MIWTRSIMLRACAASLGARTGTRRGRRRGAAAVEFALVAPVFLAFVFGIVEVGRLVMVQQLLTNGSRQGARTAILEGATVADVQAAVDAFLASSSISGATVNVSPNPLSNAVPGDAVSVSVSIPFNQVNWTHSHWFVTNVQLSGTSVMRKEGIP